MTSVLNLIIDQKLFPEKYVSGESVYRIPDKLIKAFEELHDVATKDPYLIMLFQDHIIELQMYLRSRLSIMIL